MKFGKIIRLLVGLILLIFGVYFFGPVEKYDRITPEIPDLDLPIQELESYLKEKESGVANLKDNNESRIVWADSLRTTRYVIVYLHGFSASPMEGHPVHVEVAKAFGMNLFIPRLAGHGIEDPDAFLTITPAELINSAKEAIAIGKLLGKEIILMSCSTGSTYSIYLAAEHPDLFKALVMYSPNIELYDPTAKLLTGPWGKFLVRQIVGERFISGTEFPEYTTKVYSSNGLIALQALIDQTMRDEVFEKVTVPYFLGAYYKNEEEQDMVVSVEAMRRFHKTSATPDPRKRMVFFPDAGDHVITSELHAKETSAVIDETIDFFTEVLNIEPVP